MAKTCICSVWMVNPKTHLVTGRLFGGSRRACEMYVAQAISKGQDPHRLVIIPAIIVPELED